eukprot:748077-Rhodomonas_salina.1
MSDGIEANRVPKRRVTWHRLVNALCSSQALRFPLQKGVAGSPFRGWDLISTSTSTSSSSRKSLPRRSRLGHSYFPT